MAHIHSVFDSSEHFVIDPVSREITNSLAKKIVVMQNDHNSERFTFEIPKVDSHNMANCDRVEIHYINIDAADKSLKSTGVYEVEDIQPSPDDNSVACFSWLLSRNCTKYAGTLSFLIHFACTTDGVEDYAWNTAIFQSITIGNGMNNGAEVVEPFPDILAQWKSQLFSASETAVLNVTTAETNALAAIEAAGEAKKQSVLDSIPDEYEALSALADRNHRNKAGAIVPYAEGESIVINDASEYPVQNLKVFGKSTQNGTPTPDAPVDIVSVENPVVKVYGKNLLNLPQSIEKPTSNYNYDIFTNTAGQSTPVPVEKISLLPYVEAGKTYFFSCEIPELAVAAGVKLMAVNDDGTIGDESGTAIAILAVNSGAFVPTKSSFVTVRVGTADAVTIRNVQLEMGETATEYEPHIEAQTVETSHTLPGIPVSGGGNYTDADGQQWICDEVDLARGVYVQRVYSENRVFSYDEMNNRYSTTLTHTANAECADDQGIPVFSDVLPFHNAAGSGNPTINGIRGAASSPKYVIAYYNGEEITNATVTYPLATPIETPLSDAEINAFKALHSNKPNTVILNDSGAHMAVEYVADTKTYIDNKITEMMKGMME